MVYIEYRALYSFIELPEYFHETSAFLIHVQTIVDPTSTLAAAKYSLLTASSCHFPLVFEHITVCVLEGMFWGELFCITHHFKRFYMPLFGVFLIRSLSAPTCEAFCSMFQVTSIDYRRIFLILFSTSRERWLGWVRWGHGTAQSWVCEPQINSRYFCFKNNVKKKKAFSVKYRS